MNVLWRLYCKFLRIASIITQLQIPIMVTNPVLQTPLKFTFNLTTYRALYFFSSQWKCVVCLPIPCWRRKEWCLQKDFLLFFLPSHYRLHSGAQVWFCLQTESRHSKKVTFAYQWVDFKRNTVVSSESLRYSWAELNKKGGAGLGKWCLSFEGIRRSTNTWPPVCTFLSWCNMDILTFAKIQSISWSSLICDCPA